MNIKYFTRCSVTSVRLSQSSLLLDSFISYINIIILNTCFKLLVNFSS